MDITGKVVKVLPLVTGEGRNGPWKKQEFVVETPGQYPKQICCSIWGDKVDDFKVQENEELKVHIDIQSREHNERWYTEVRAWKIERDSSNQAPPPSENDFVDVQPDSDEEDDLPF